MHRQCVILVHVDSRRRTAALLQQMGAAPATRQPSRRGHLSCPTSPQPRSSARRRFVVALYAITHVLRHQVVPASMRHRSRSQQCTMGRQAELAGSCLHAVLKSTHARCAAGWSWRTAADRCRQLRGAGHHLGRLPVAAAAAPGQAARSADGAAPHPSHAPAVAAGDDRCSRRPLRAQAVVHLTAAMSSSHLQLRLRLCSPCETLHTRGGTCQLTH